MEVKAVVALLLFVVPGFLAGELKDHLRHVRPPGQFEKTVQAIILSALAYLALLLVDGLLTSHGAITGWYETWNKVLTTSADLSVLTSGPLLFSYALVLLISTAEGFATAFFLNQWWDRLVGHISHRNHYQRVWDELFHMRELRHPIYASALMKDGTIYHGVVHRSSDIAGEKELLLREAYRSYKDAGGAQPPAQVGATFVYLSESHINALYIVSELVNSQRTTLRS